MTFEWWFAYLLTSIILSLSPGSGAINTMTTSLNHGYRGAMASIAGLQTGLAIHIVLVGVGLGTLFSRSVIAFEVLKWAGAAYLIWLGIQQWRAAGAIDGVTTIVVDIIVMIGYATLAQRIALWIKGPKQMKALNKIFGSLFMLVGALLASARHA